MNTLTPIAYAIYLIGITTTALVVSRLIIRHGRIFITQGYDGNTALTQAAAGMLQTQFNLIALAAMLLLLRFSKPGSESFLFPSAPQSVPALFEVLSVKLGIMLLVIGIMHFLSLRLINRIRLGGEIL